MTEERRLELEEKLNMAEASSDEAMIAAVKKTMEQEYRLCTSHTAARLKRVETTVNEIKAGLIPADMFQDIQKGMNNLAETVRDTVRELKGMKNVADTVRELKSEVESWKNKAKGAKLLWTILGYIAAAGGSGYIMKLILATSKTASSSGLTP